MTESWIQSHKADELLEILMVTCVKHTYSREVFITSAIVVSQPSYGLVEECGHTRNVLNLHPGRLEDENI